MIKWQMFVNYLFDTSIFNSMQCEERGEKEIKSNATYNYFCIGSTSSDTK